MAEIKIEKPLAEVLQQEVRLPMSKLPLKKTGYNKHLGYYYFDLKDFLPQATELFAKAGICPVYNIITDQNGEQIATMALVKGAERMQFQIPTAEVPNMNGVFNLGSKDKYCLRYLLVNHVLMLSEDDPAELSNTNSNNPVIEEKKATSKQVEMLRSLYDEENVAKMLEYYNIQSLDELSLKTASELIARKKNGTH